MKENGTQLHKITQEQIVAAHLASHSNLFNSTIEYGITTVKVAILINGGAAIALLTFFGNVPPNGSLLNVATPLFQALLFFGAGVFSGGLAAAVAYFTQLRYLEEFSLTGTVNTNSTARVWLEYSTVALFLFSFILFGFGVWQSYEAIFQTYSTRVLVRH